MNKDNTTRHLRAHTHTPGCDKPRYELADIFNRYWDAFAAKFGVSNHQYNTVQHIRNCRTSRLKYHIEYCSNKDCDYRTPAYNSCRDRNCPKCLNSKRMKWVHDRLLELLPIPYFHAVFTMPHSFLTFILYNPALVFDLFFKAAAYTMNAFARKAKYLGADIGFYGILHTWGQTLAYHPHIHFIVTGGGFSNGDENWQRLPYQEKFIFPVKTMSRLMRRKFVELLKQAWQKEELRYPARIAQLESEDYFDEFCRDISKKTWYIYAKPPFSGPEKVIEYFSRYTHRVAIANGRLLAIDNDRVSFTYRDYHDDNRIKVMSLSADRFIQRFLRHILPAGFKKIRHHGIFSPGCRTAKLAEARAYFEKMAAEKLAELAAKPRWMFTILRGKPEPKS